MKSKQINFFILPEDLLEIQSFFKGKRLLFITEPIINIENCFKESISYPKPKNEFSKIYLLLEDFKDQIVFDKIDEQSYYLVNDYVSPVIEFSRGGFLYYPDKLERARLFFKTGYYENNIFITKDMKFINFAIDLLKEFRKKFIIIKNGNQYLFSWMYDGRLGRRWNVDPICIMGCCKNLCYGNIYSSWYCNCWQNNESCKFSAR